jgi:hypothetical protein
MDRYSDIWQSPILSPALLNMSVLRSFLHFGDTGNLAGDLGSGWSVEDAFSWAISAIRFLDLSQPLQQAEQRLPPGTLDQIQFLLDGAECRHVGNASVAKIHALSRLRGAG